MIEDFPDPPKPPDPPIIIDRFLALVGTIGISAVLLALVIACIVLGLD